MEPSQRKIQKIAFFIVLYFNLWYDNISVNNFDGLMWPCTYQIVVAQSFLSERLRNNFHSSIMFKVVWIMDIICKSVFICCKKSSDCSIYHTLCVGFYICLCIQCCFLSTRTKQRRVKQFMLHLFNGYIFGCLWLCILSFLLSQVEYFLKFFMLCSKRSF